jgi:hypothetical protein
MSPEELDRGAKFLVAVQKLVESMGLSTVRARDQLLYAAAYYARGMHCHDFSEVAHNIFHSVEELRNGN